MQEIQRLRIEQQQTQAQQQAQGQTPPIIVQGTPSATDIVNEFTKVGKLDNFDGDETQWPEWDFNLLGDV